MNSHEPIFHNDEVHFIDLGNYKLFRSYRAAISLGVTAGNKGSV